MLASKWLFLATPWTRLAQASTLTAILLAAITGASKPIDGQTVTPRHWQPEALLDGDLVFRTGTDIVASIVLAQGEAARFSHVGLILEIEGGLFVIHAIPGEGGSGGVRSEPLETFASSAVAREVAYFRIDDLDERQRLRIRRYSLAQLGKPFDYYFRYSDDDAHYCTELALKALEDAGIHLEPLMPRVTVPTLSEGAIPPDSLRQSAFLRELRAPPDENGSRA